MKCRKKNYFDWEYAKYRAKELKIPQYKLADMINTSQSMVARWFNNATIPELYYIVLMAAALRLPVQNLIKDVDE